MVQIPGKIFDQQALTSFNVFAVSLTATPKIAIEYSLFPVIFGRTISVAMGKGQRALVLQLNSYTNNKNATKNPILSSVSFSILAYSSTRVEQKLTTILIQGVRPFGRAVTRWPLEP